MVKDTPCRLKLQHLARKRLIRFGAEGAASAAIGTDPGHIRFVVSHGGHSQVGPVVAEIANSAYSARMAEMIHSPIDCRSDSIEFLLPPEAIS
jgi:hypothetical protein